MQRGNWFVWLGFALISAPASAQDPDRCAALNQLFMTARTDFPSLRQSNLYAGHCTLAGKAFKCQWGFPSDRFISAKEQASRLRDCTAAQNGTRPLGEKHGAKGFQINPETSVFIRGPVMSSGEWTLILKIDSSADWN